MKGRPAATGFNRTRQATLRAHLPSVHTQVTARPELAGVGIATDVLDAVKWGA